MMMAMVMALTIDQAIGDATSAAAFNARSSPFSAGAYAVIVIANGGGHGTFPGGGSNANAGELGQQIISTVFLPPETKATIDVQPSTSANGLNVTLRGENNNGVSAIGGTAGGRSPENANPYAGYTYSPAGKLFWGQASGALTTQIGEGGSGLYGSTTAQLTGKRGLIRFKKLG